MKITHAAHLDDSTLTTELARLAAVERDAGVALIVHLAEFDARRLYEPAGFSSTFTYCRDVLKLSEDAVYNRIEAARAARKWPRILEMLATGSLTLTTARLLGRRVTVENQDALVTAAAGKGKAEVEELLARCHPRPEVAPMVRKLPVPRALLGVAAGISEMSSTGTTVSTGTGAEAPPESRGALTGAMAYRASSAGAALTGGAVPVDGTLTGSAVPVGPFLRSDPVPPPSASDAPMLAAPAHPSRAVVRPLAADRYEVRFTATAEMREKLRLAQDLLGHAVPSGDLTQVFDRALTALISELARRRFGATDRKRRSGGQAAGSRHIPAAVRRAVVIRDRGRCAFVSRDGRLCGERRFLEFHHVVPHVASGPPTVENIAMRCRAHNGHEVDLFFGPGVRVDRRKASMLETGGAERTRPGTSDSMGGSASLRSG